MRKSPTGVHQLGAADRQLFPFGKLAVHQLNLFLGSIDRAVSLPTGFVTLRRRISPGGSSGETGCQKTRLPKDRLPKDFGKPQRESARHVVARSTRYIACSVLLHDGQNIDTLNRHRLIVRTDQSASVDRGRDCLFLHVHRTERQRDGFADFCCVRWRIPPWVRRRRCTVRTDRRATRRFRRTLTPVTEPPARKFASAPEG